MNKYFLLFFVLSVRFFLVDAQNTGVILPFSEQYQLSPLTDFVNMPEFDYNKMINEDKARVARGEKRYRFAKKIPVDLMPFSEGFWEEVPNGGRIWRIGIRSVNAHSLYVVLRNFEIVDGVRIFAYNPSKKEWHGPFSSTNNNKYNVLAIPPVPGNEIIIELNVDPGVYDFGTFSIQEVWHDYRNIFGGTRIKSTLFNSGSCNVDINCSEGTPWQLEKRAVCRFIANGEYCTGTLINNVAGRKIPYLISAYHCIEEADIAASAMFYFDYEKPICKGSTVSRPVVVNGSELMATTPNQLDFSLVKLNRFPAITDGLYLAGWNANFDNPQKGVCIHHPSGDVKKISITNSPLYTSDFGEGFNQNSHWLVARWDVGTTEGGSSGAPIFDNQHRLVGTLSGGDAECGNSVNDFFTKFALSWDFYSDSSKQLKYWLDPEKSGVRVLSGSAPYGVYKPGCDTVSNVAKTDPLVNEQTGSWGYLTGNNSYGDSEFAEKFTISNPVDIPGIFIIPSVVNASNAFANVTFKIWDGTDMPGNEVYSKSYFMKYLEPGILNFIEFDSLVHLNGTFFIGYTVNYQTPVDTFALYHVSNRNAGLSTLFIKRNNMWGNGKDITLPAFYTSMAISFTSCEPLETPAFEDMRLYPNPASDDINISLPSLGNISDVECFNVLGKKQNIEWQMETQGRKLIVNIRHLQSGVYGIRFTLDGKEYTKQFVVMNPR